MDRRVVSCITYNHACGTGADTPSARHCINVGLVGVLAAPMGWLSIQDNRMPERLNVPGNYLMDQLFGRADLPAATPGVYSGVIQRFGTRGGGAEARSGGRVSQDHSHHAGSISDPSAESAGPGMGSGREWKTTSPGTKEADALCESLFLSYFGSRLGLPDVPDQRPSSVPGTDHLQRA
jgi:hypothetical protein